MPKVYIIIVNWNAWRHTVECLESVFRLKYDNFVVLICDNASSDGSVERIQAWAEGRLNAPLTEPPLEYLISPPLQKPIEYAYLKSGTREELSGREERLLLVDTGGNLGFAGANNVGLRLALSAKCFDYAWLLNNDTVVHPAALSHLVERMAANPSMGMCGSAILYYSEPDTVQALGGSTYNKWVARGHHIGGGIKFQDLGRFSDVERRMKYVVGASMLVSRALIELVGMLNEQYFLYAEEIDWATRAKGKFTLGFAAKSLVYHKEGGSIGTARQSSLQPLISEYYATRNRVLFTKTFFPLALPSVLGAVISSSLHRLLRGHAANSITVLRAIYDGFKSRGDSFSRQGRVPV